MQTNKNLHKKAHKLIIISIFILIITSCQNNLNTEDNVAIVDNVYISKDLYSQELNFYSSFYSKKYGDNYLNKDLNDGTTNFHKLEKDVLNSLIIDQMMLNDLKKHNYKISNSEYENLNKELIKKLDSKESLIANIKAINSDEVTFSDILFRDSIKFEHKKMFEKNSKIKDKEILAYYEKTDKLKKMYKYNALVFDDDLEATKIRDKIKNNQDFRKVLNYKTKNFEIINSDFVYNDDKLLTLSQMTNKDTVSDVFKYKNKNYILMINSYNENENDLLINAKDYYMNLKYEEYLKDLIKSSNVRVFV